MKHKTLLLNCAIIFLTLIFILIAGLGFLKQKYLNKQNKTEYEEWNETNSNLVDSVNMNLSECTSFYYKILNKEDINILVIGDEFALSSGLENESYAWTNYLSQWLEYTYLTKTKITRLGTNNALITDGIATFDNNKSSLNYDMVIMCYGSADSKAGTSITEFCQNYSNLIGNIKSVNFEAKIIALIPPDITLQKEYIKSINRLGELNNIKVINILSAFTNMKDKSEILMIDNYPTEKGYAVFATTIETYIKYFLKN